MSQLNTYPGPKESQPFAKRRGGGANSHQNVPSNKKTKDAPDGDLGSFSYKGKADSYYKTK